MTDRDARYEHFVRAWWEAEIKDWLTGAVGPNPERLNGAPTAFIDPDDVMDRSDLTVGRFVKNLVRERHRIVIGRKKAPEGEQSNG